MVAVASNGPHRLWRNLWSGAEVPTRRKRPIPRPMRTGIPCAPSRSRHQGDPSPMPSSAHRRRASLCAGFPTPPKLISGFPRDPHSTNEAIGPSSTPLNLPKIQVIEGFTNGYPNKTSSSTSSYPNPNPSSNPGQSPSHKGLLDRPAFRQEGWMGRRASLPVISHPLPADPDLREYTFPGVSEEERSGPYSRTPALKVSHKLAERKRRKEMKELFDELREHLPVEKRVKLSKWEILSKSFEYIQQLHTNQEKLSREASDLRHQVAVLKQARRSSS
ncbi:hypothetical protein K493DRAFT_53785 [Basidiobolus meristosporus CBS 931.73]|uniref:BHLH domain-containing protein n=1 Tax=Basidiobolus meristosporus CBS 931.73 TaxID=1314790 RepID=A0A1Y1XZL3_9FUNG|nr:hypothetical protein K493DRAFT_53785 [Basidiobolus meristosporus CBS 931.73]|eukprot:ORX91105.1 hypothetical protein K493DRAFT_53785 [Basidiobolus meristosporus CBS 931.73]